MKKMPRWKDAKCYYFYKDNLEGFKKYDLSEIKCLIS